MMYPPIYKDWNNYPDIKGLDKYQLVSKLAMSWDVIEPKNESCSWGIYGTLLELEWDRTIHEYPGLTKGFNNLEKVREKHELIHKYNPNILLGVEMRWDAIMEYDLPEDHRWWKRDKDGNRIRYKQNIPQRYEVDIYNDEYLQWLAERCKAILDTKLIDFLIFDHIKFQLWTGGDPLPMVKKVREVVGPNALLLGNTHFDMMPEISKYISAWGEKDDEGKYQPEEVICFWDDTKEMDKVINCWEFVGPADDLKQMRYYTTLVMTCSNAAVRYINHHGVTKPSPWYEFWDTNIGKYISERKIINGCYFRENLNGTTVCNNTDTNKIIPFGELRKRASNGEINKEFIIESMDGDMFLYSRSE